MVEGLQLRLEPCVHCPTCPALPLCDEGATEYGCDNEYSATLRSRDVLHPLHPRLTELLASSGGLDVEFRRMEMRPQPSLPAYVPRVQLQARVLQPAWPALALPLDRIATKERIRTSHEIRELLGVAPDTKLIVTGFQHDEVLEARWARLDPLARALADADYDLIAAPNFSLWKGDPRLEHLFNIVRTIRFVEALSSRGVVTRPHVSFFLNRDVDNWIAELRRWPQVRTFSLDFATFDTQKEWDANLARVRRLFDGIGDDYEVLVNGVAKPERIIEIGQVIRRFSVVNEHAYHLAMSRHATREQLGTRIRAAPSDLARDTIFRVEVERMAADVQRAIRHEAVPSRRSPYTSCGSERVAVAVQD